MNKVNIREVYESALYSVHYSSVTQYYEYLESRQVDRRFGTSCGFQALAVGRALEEAGIDDVRYYMDGRHAAVICRDDDGERYLCDPYLMHTTPISLIEAARPEGVDVEAYPITIDENGVRHTSQLKVRYLESSNVISLQYLRLAAGSTKRTLSRYFRLRLDRPVEGPPAPEEVRMMLFHPEQNNLSVRVIDPKHGAVISLIYPVCLYHGLGRPSVEHLQIVTSEQSLPIAHSQTLPFQTQLRRMARVLGVASDNLVQFVMEGVNIYERHAPASIQYHAYPVTPQTQTATS